MQFYFDLTHSRFSLFIFTLSVSLIFACNSESGSKNAKGTISSELIKPKLIEVKSDSTDLLFLYQDAQGKEQRSEIHLG